MTYVIAHRGSSRLEHENTIAAYRRAVGDGADGIELDVRRSADGVLVCHHDARVASGAVIAATPRAELPDLVPTLEAALDACRGVWVNLEIKNDEMEPDFDPDDGVLRATLELLAERDEPSDNWLLSSFRPVTIERCRALAPDVPTALLTYDVTPDLPAKLADAGHVAVHPWDPMVDAALIDRCQRVGLQVNAWTCNQPDRFVQLAEWGIDGICTDIPDVMVSALDPPTPT